MAISNFARNLRDAAFTVTKAMPAAAATNYSDALDLGQERVQSLESVEFEISLPATPSLVDAKTILFAVQDSADNVTFAAVDPAITTGVLGAGGAGAAAKAVRFRLPSTTRRYVRISQTVLAAGGDNTAISSTFSALF